MQGHVKCKICGKFELKMLKRDGYKKWEEFIMELQSTSGLQGEGEGHRPLGCNGKEAVGEVNLRAASQDVFKQNTDRLSLLAFLSELRAH